MAKFDWGGLSKFLEKGDKRRPPAFVGRGEVLRDIIRTAELAWEGRLEGSPGETRIIQGAPGAGKSSILAELDGRLNVGKPKEGVPRILNIDSVKLTSRNLPLTLKKLAELIDSRAAVSFLSGIRRDLSVGVSANILNAGGGLNVSNRRTQSPFSAGFSALESWIISKAKKKAMRWPIIFAVDEAQNLPEGNQTGEAQLLRDLHASPVRFPITLVLAGLSSTEHVANGLGLTRGLHFHRIGRFGGNDSVEVLFKFCERFGIEIGNCGGNLEVLAKPTEGWPRHLHWALIAIGKAALIKGIDGKLDRIENWNTIETESRKSRIDYYLRQQSNLMGDSAYLVSTVMKQLGKGLAPGEVKQLIEESEGKPKPWRIPANMNSDQFYNHLVHQGALEIQDNGTVHCPMPSFRNFLISKGPRNVSL